MICRTIEVRQVLLNVADRGTPQGVQAIYRKDKTQEGAAGELSCASR